jgi:site-specific DNA recombinase
MEEKPTPSAVRAALYARVSSEQQAQQCTIQSQVEAIKERVRADGLTLDGELCFLDDGYTGSTLMRPALERFATLPGPAAFNDCMFIRPTG